MRQTAHCLLTTTLAAVIALAPTLSHARGGRGGGGARMGGGGFGGGARMGGAGGFGGAGGYGGARGPVGGAGGYGGARGPVGGAGGFGGAGGYGGAGMGAGGYRGTPSLGRATPRPSPVAGGRFGGAGSGAALGAAGGAGRFGAGAGGGRPSASDLSSFLGLPAGGGGVGAGSRGYGTGAAPAAGQLPAGSASGGRHSQVWQGDHFTIGAAGGSGSYTGPRGNTIGGAGAAVGIQGPRGNTVVRGAGAIGATNGVDSVGRAGGFVGAQGPAGNRAVAGRGATFANGQIVGGHTWSAVNGNFNHWNCFHPGWYGRYPGAWYPARWAAASVWTAASWAALSGWWGYGGEPVYYDYGGDVAYNDGQVYYGDEPVATQEQYYNEATDIAAMGDQPAADDEQWLPLGVFAVANDGQTNSDKLFQLAVNKAGVLRGNYHDLMTDQVVELEGAVDRQTQRAAWHLKDNPTMIMETGIYNLTNDEVPILVHYSADKTEQRMLVRLDNPNPPAADSETGTPAEGAGGAAADPTSDSPPETPSAPSDR